MNFSDDQKKTLLVIVVFGVLALGGVGWYWWFFGNGKIKTFEAETVKLNEDVKGLDVQIKEIEDFEDFTQGKYKELERHLATVEKRLPQSREAIEFFTELNEILHSTGVITERLATDRIVTEPGQGYDEIPYSIVGKGRFHEFGQFLNLVEQNPDRFMRVKTLKLTNEPGRPSLHPIEVTIATFKFSKK